MEKNRSGKLIELRIKGHIDPNWYAWCAGAQVEHLSCGDSIILIEVHDRSALFGLLNQLQDSGIEIISFHPSSNV